MLESAGHNKEVCLPTVNRLNRNLGNLNIRSPLVDKHYPLIMEEKIINKPAGLGPVLTCDIARIICIMTTA